MHSFQQTVARAVAFRGVGLHSGLDVRVLVRPASAGAGVAFRRVDLPGAPSVAARPDRTGGLMLCTTLDGGNGATVATVEHLMAALAAAGVDNAVIDLDGPEVPALDGSAAPFLAALRSVGAVLQKAPRRYLRVLRRVEVVDGDRWAALEPHDGLALDVTVDFPHPSVGQQRWSGEIDGRIFDRALARARTFAFEAEIKAMRRSGFARGGSLDNAVVIGADGPLNPDGLRFADECVRHKALDAVGDLYLAGALLARFVAVRPGHALTNTLLRALAATPCAWEWHVPAELRTSATE